MTSPLPASWDAAAAHRLLLAGDERALPELRAILSQLPVTARGQVFVEVSSDSEIEVLEAPGRFTVTWLRRDRGQDLARSVDAWLSEMLPISAFTESTVYAWIASQGPARLLSSN
ncbi:NADPH-dependent ferric siderophore reductase [Microbacteriaceae bacterium SG_E_30_P1]|uniref:NADPH-dependent ferric siderophore reductase n=1 Tax=Antiquaquibacter oligotrophicus TaxID=2880260 RepID=A0ABT6KN09_9MICO|nr:SIP domain-containing protein [Antiquaquibacter oligotrophicus]MDH6180527.1 NADPH-dependent ferric siderophore reductase [Antiquaquibacter oligotrophicus]UDF13739.1 siderophore-interacting protein [Antiquaquibacter oligotrophicus]